MPTPVAQFANRCLIGHGTRILATVPAGRVFIVKFASITNSDVPALSGSVFMISASGGVAGAMVTALSLRTLERVAMMGAWVLGPGDQLAAVINAGNVASVHVAGLVRNA